MSLKRLKVLAKRVLHVHTHIVLRCICYFSPVIFDWLTWKWPFFLTFSCVITPISGAIDHYKSWKNKNKLRTIYPKNNENFKNNKGSSFTGVYQKLCFEKLTTPTPKVYHLILRVSVIWLKKMVGYFQPEYSRAR